MLYLFLALLLSIFLAVFGVPLYVDYHRRHWNVSSKRVPSFDIWIFAVAAAIVTVMAVFLYFQWGASQALAQFYTTREALKNLHQGHAEQVQTIKQNFLTYLKTNPRDAKGWYLLGRLYLDEGNVAKAVEAFKQSFESDPEKNSEILAQYAQALYLNNQHQLTLESLSLTQEALSKDPQNVTALNLLAMDAFSHHRYALAMTYWKRLRNQYPEESPEFQTLTEAIRACSKSC